MASTRVVGTQIRKEPERDPDALPDSTDLSGPCTRCGRVSNFTLVGTAPVSFRRDGSYAVAFDGEPSRLFDEQVAILECNGCRDCMVVIEEQLTGGIRGGTSGTVTYRGFYWWPTPGASTLGTDVPQNVTEAYSEAMRCLSASAPNAAVSMFRTTLSYIVEDKGSAAVKAGPDLKEKLKQLVAEGGFPSSLSDWATHLRLYGNAGAHPDLFGNVSVEEAKDVAMLTHTLIEVLYVLPGNIVRRQAGRNQPN